MRQKINENPVYQAAVIAVLVIAFAVVFMTQVAGRGADEAATATDPAAVPAESTAVPGVAPGAESAIGSQPVPDASSAGLPPVTSATAAFKPGPGLPEDVVSAHEEGMTVVLLVRRANAIDDREMKTIVDDLDDRDVSTFDTRINGVERYSRITVGLDVDRAPALIVIRPKRFDIDGQPQASIVYGLQSRQATEQRIRDAVYSGPDDLPYHPG